MIRIFPGTSDVRVNPSCRWRVCHPSRTDLGLLLHIKGIVAKGTGDNSGSDGRGGGAHAKQKAPPRSLGRR
ncbi:hypothetical protein ACFX13_016691 [Malus domestica]